MNGNRPISGVALTTVASVRLMAGTAQVASQSTTVSPPALRGAAANTHNDDGTNVWFEGGYRMQVAGHFMSQSVTQSPIDDPWTLRQHQNGIGMAPGPVLTPQGLRAVYGTFYDDRNTLISRIEKTLLGGSPPTYSLPRPTGSDAAGEIYQTVLQHSGDESPWAIDAHLFYDTDTARLWMTWGGHNGWICELDPTTGVILDPSTRSPLGSPEFRNHPSGVHTRVADFKQWRGLSNVASDPNYPAATQAAPDNWDGDTFSHGYAEGFSLFKHANFWYMCGSYGSMGQSYTIRCCRSAFDASSPHTGARGPYLDKDGLTCTDFHASRNRYGASMLLGPDGDQLVPGHPHMWAETSGETYLGYDFRPGSPTAPDVMGIRRLHWHDGWPTIWTPLTLTFNSDDFPAAVGQLLTIELSNTGNALSKAAFDGVRISESPTATPSPAPPPPSPPPPPPPLTAAPAPPLSSLTPLTLSEAALSSVYHPIYGAANAIDGNMNNIAASNFQPNAWLSVRVPSGARIGLVAVYNRGDGERYQELLGSFEVWVGTSAASQGTRCGGWSGTTRSVGPFVINCGGTSGGEWVTVRQVGNARYLTIGELLAFAEAVPGSTRASPPPPPLSVTPPPPRAATINTIAAVLSCQ